MIDAQYAKTLARYNQWMNARLYALCDGLGEEVLREDRGAFFGSIYLTLNHILYGDLAFMSRFTGEPAEVPELGVELCSDFAALRQERAQRSWLSARHTPVFQRNMSVCMTAASF